MSINESEDHLGKLSRKTFLSMWSYQNPFHESGKELCDVLVVFGNDVIIMSDKLINFGNHPDLAVSWKRWYKKAVSDSARQLLGARHQLIQSPTKVYCDASASSLFPLRLPPINQSKFHLVAIANGAEEKCMQSLGHGSFRINTRSKGNEEPFTVGTIFGKGDFIHVISKPTLEAMFDCFDTTQDFIEYLDRKEAALTEEAWIIDGEENLIAGYMQSQPGNRPFCIPSSSFPLEEEARIVCNGIWCAYDGSEIKQTRSSFRAPSYVIDNIVEHVAEEYKQKKLIIGQDKELSYHEEAFRLIARESRLARQLIGLALREIWDESTDTFWSTVVESPEHPGIYYLWLLYPEPPKDWGIDYFERVLMSELSKYMAVARSKFEDAQRIFGLCLPNRDCKQVSRMFRIIDGAIWSEDMQERAKNIQASDGILASIETTEHWSSRQ